MPKPNNPIVLVRINDKGEIKTLALPTTKKLLLAFYNDALNNEYITAIVRKKGK